MIANEQQLLPRRVQGSQQLFILIIAVQAAMFAVPIALFGFQYLLLNKALQEREMAESNARHLSGRVLQLQDEERRKFARELHDGLGQSLCVAKIAASKANESYPTDANVAEIDRILEQSLNETRTISYLLHPPLLDEMGFASAATWYVEGFAQRSGIEVSIHMGKEIDRLPRETELALFRIVQESLINIHKHAKSPRADVSLNISGNEVTLRIRDYGQGIPADRLARFQTSGSQFGLGLAGMRERAREHGGRFEIQSNPAGTTISVRMPRGVLEAPERQSFHPAVRS
jgi:signal transduction histidine kinase